MDARIKTTNVLGSNVSVMTPDNAAERSIELMKSRENHRIFMLTAASSLVCNEDKEIAELVSQCDLILAGDEYIEKAAFSKEDSALQKSEDKDYVESYFDDLFAYLQNGNRLIYAVVEKEDELEKHINYFKNLYSNIRPDGIVFKDYDNTVNEINAVIPDVLLICLSVDKSLLFLRDYVSMVNAKLIIIMDGLNPNILKAAKKSSRIIQALHLDRLYHWFKKDQNFQKSVAETKFKNQIADSFVQNDEDSNQ